MHALLKQLALLRRKHLLQGVHHELKLHDPLPQLTPLLALALVHLRADEPEQVRSTPQKVVVLVVCPLGGSARNLWRGIGAKETKYGCVS